MVEVRMTETMGRGVFATVPIPAGTVLGSWHTLTLKEVPRPVADHVFEDDDGSACIVFGWLSLVNHGPANIRTSWHMTDVGEVVVAVAARDIQAGEQVLNDYRFDANEMPSWAA